jgi:hypothetical protein
VSETALKEFHRSIAFERITLTASARKDLEARLLVVPDEMTDGKPSIAVTGVAKKGKIEASSFAEFGEHPSEYRALDRIEIVVRHSQNGRDEQPFGSITVILSGEWTILEVRGIDHAWVLDRYSELSPFLQQLTTVYSPIRRYIDMLTYTPLPVSLSFWLWHGLYFQYWLKATIGFVLFGFGILGANTYPLLVFHGLRTHLVSHGQQNDRIKVGGFAAIALSFVVLMVVILLFGGRG